MCERALPVATYESHTGFGRELGRHDLDAVAVAKHRAQGHRLAVHGRRDAVVAHVRVHAVGEVDGRRPARQREDLALGREDVDLLREEVHLDVLEELERVARFALDLQQRLQPLVRLQLHVLAAALRALVEPVGGDAGLGHLVHVRRADLHLDGHAEGPKSVVCRNWYPFAFGMAM